MLIVCLSILRRTQVRGVPTRCQRQILTGRGSCTEGKARASAAAVLREPAMYRPVTASLAEAEQTERVEHGPVAMLVFITPLSSLLFS